VVRVFSDQRSSAVISGKLVLPITAMTRDVGDSGDP